MLPRGPCLFYVVYQEEFDVVRLMKLASFGALVHGSTGHFFYNFLDSKIPGTAALTVAKKVFIDQVREMGRHNCRTQVVQVMIDDECIYPMLWCFKDARGCQWTRSLLG